MVTVETDYRVPGVDDPGPDDLEEGTRLVVQGLLTPNGTMAARVAAVQRPDRPGRWLLGEASAGGRRGMIVQTLRGSLPIRTGDDTRIRVPGVEDATLSDVSPGRLIAVSGVSRRGGTVVARIVAVLPRGAARLIGEVVALEDDIIVVESEGGLVEIITADGTFGALCRCRWPHAQQSSSG